VIEEGFAWLHGFRRLRIRWERRADIHAAFLKLAGCLIAHRQLGSLRQPLLCLSVADKAARTGTPTYTVRGGAAPA
jgi:hypothetical protein